MCNIVSKAKKNTFLTGLFSMPSERQRLKEVGSKWSDPPDLDLREMAGTMSFYEVSCPLHFYVSPSSPHSRLAHIYIFWRSTEIVVCELSYFFCILSYGLIAVEEACFLYFTFSICRSSILLIIFTELYYYFQVEIHFINLFSLFIVQIDKQLLSWNYLTITISSVWNRSHNCSVVYPLYT